MIGFDEVTVDDAERILKWRVSHRVTKYMNTDVEFNIDNQRRWLVNSYSKDSYYHWIIKSENRPVGLIYLSDFDFANKVTSWGFYIGEDDCVGLGAFIPPYFYNFLFLTVGLERIDAQVFYSNLSVLGLHKLHGYKFAPAKDQVIEKNGSEILLVAMSLSSEDWIANKRFRKQVAEFPIGNWKANPIGGVKEA